MKKQATILTLLALLLLTFSASALAAAPAKPAAKKPAAAPAKSMEELNTTLAAFAQVCAREMNESILPCKAKKEVLPAGDGFLARYIEVDASRIDTHVVKSDSSVVPYIGYMTYTETWFHCRGKTREEALNADCTEAGSKQIQELIKYMGGKWTY